MPYLRTAGAALAGLATVTLTALGQAAFLAPADAALPEPARSACRNAAEVPVETRAVFNDPVAGRATAVIEELCSLVKQAPAGSSIELAAFVISGDAGGDYVAVLLEAHRRGVDIRLVIDGYQVDNPAARELITTLGDDTTADSWAHVCSHMSPEGNTTSCQGTKGMHNKFLLFSETGGQRDVVVQASNNITDVNSRSYWNNAVLMPGNTKLFEAYGAYFDDLAAEAQAPDYYRTVSTGMRGGQVTAAFYPAATRDPIAERLDQVGCKAQGRTQVEIGQSEWDATRLGIVDSLARLVEEGCRVRVVHGLADEEVLTALDAAGVARRALDGATPAGRIHSKYIVVTGAAGQGSPQSWVMTGSHNFNHTSLRRNDEAMVELSEPRVVTAYADNFTRLWHVAQ
jgi:phosphatidylserine/phosphatidylglycerophosphate/cardiolipin synthase-like enzyme